MMFRDRASAVPGGGPRVVAAAHAAPRGPDLAKRTGMNEFKADLDTIRRRAREKMEQGAVTASYAADRDRVIEVLNEVLATEIVCVLRYKNHYYMASGIHAAPVAAEFAEHAAAEQDHADRIAKRIIELGGVPNFNPDGLHTRSHAEYHEGGTLEAMIREDLVAERIAISTHSEIVRWIANDART